MAPNHSHASTHARLKAPTWQPPVCKRSHPMQRPLCARLSLQPPACNRSHRGSRRTPASSLSAACTYTATPPVQVCRSVLALDPSHPRANFKCASALRQLRRQSEALLHYRRHLEHYPADEQVPNPSMCARTGLRSRCDARGHVQSALEHAMCNRWLSVAPICSWAIAIHCNSIMHRASQDLLLQT